MAPNPISIPRKPERRDFHQQPPRRDVSRPPGMTTPYVATSIFMLVLATLPWARRWFLSGAAIESLFIIYGYGYDKPSIPLWTFLATLNLIYAVCSTSWLLYALFVSICYPSMLLTALFQFPTAAKLARKILRKVLGQHPQFIKDKLALFNLPALEIDTEVDGLLVVRGVTLSFSNLTLVARGVELGLKVADDIELAIYVDEVTVSLFRSIEIGDVYANVKGGQFEMTFGEMEDPSDDAEPEISVFLDDTPLLRAATVGGKSYKSRPKLRETLTGVTWITDSSAKVRSAGKWKTWADAFQAGLQNVKTLDPDDEIADKEYHDALHEIQTTSAVYQSRQQVRQKSKGENGISIDNENDMRASISTELHTLPSVPHPPKRSVRVTTLQNLSSPKVRRFMHRLPLLLRLLLSPISHLHPITISSINATGSGKWLSSMLKKQVFKQYTENNAELRRLQRKVARWTADANFCVQLTDIQAMGQVPLSTFYDIVTYLKFDEVIAYRTVPESATITQVVRLGGADATFTIPSYLLPHHEHILPPLPTPQDEKDIEDSVHETEGTPKALQVEKELEKLRKDETGIAMSVHGSLPASCDQSLLNFIAALVKSTKIIELEKDLEDVSDPAEATASSTFSDSDADSVSSVPPPSGKDLSMKDIAGFKMLARNIRQNLSDGTTKAQMKDFAKELHHTTRHGMKKALVGGLVNDRWIARMVGKVAATLRKAQGDVGYSGSIPIPLAPYRAEADLPSKLLP